MNLKVKTPQWLGGVWQRKGAVLHELTKEDGRAEEQDAGDTDWHTWRFRYTWFFPIPIKRPLSGGKKNWGSLFQHSPLCWGNINLKIYPAANNEKSLLTTGNRKQVTILTGRWLRGTSTCPRKSSRVCWEESRELMFPSISECQHS